MWLGNTAIFLVFNQQSVVNATCIHLSSYVEKLPRIGETLSGHRLAICCGGKGANQAVTAARLGASTAIIGKVILSSLQM